MNVPVSSQSPERRWARAYRREMLIAMTGYLVVLGVSLALLSTLHGTARYALAVTPALPFAAIPWVVLRGLRRVDERERDLTYRALTFAFFGTAVVTFAYGFFELAGAPRLSTFVVWPLMGFLWIAGRLSADRLP